MTQSSLRGFFIIAMPSLDDPHFNKAVTYLCEHTTAGSMGIVINQPGNMKLGEIMSKMSISSQNPHVNKQPIYTGGPVSSERGFILHTPAGKWDSSVQVSTSIALTTSKDVLEAMAIGEGPEKTFITLGYAAWKRGQLESEIKNNVWLCGPASSEIIFDLPISQRWEAAAELLGVNIHTISTDVGHA